MILFSFLIKIATFIGTYLSPVMNSS